MGKPDLILSKSRRNPRDVQGRAMAWIRRMPGYEPIEYQPRDADGIGPTVEFIAVGQ